MPVNLDSVQRELRMQETDDGHRPDPNEPVPTQEENRMTAARTRVSCLHLGACLAAVLAGCTTTIAGTPSGGTGASAGTTGGTTANPVWEAAARQRAVAPQRRRPAEPLPLARAGAAEAAMGALQAPQVEPVPARRQLARVRRRRPCLSV